MAWLGHARGNEIKINGIPYRCPQFDSFQFNFTYAASLHAEGIRSGMIEVDGFGITNQYISVASIYLVGDVAWIGMVWSAASIGTPTEPMRRDKYLRCVFDTNEALSALIVLILHPIIYREILTSLGLDPFHLYMYY
jgi:hypothetical protein